MKIGKFVITLRKVGGHLIEDEIRDVVTDVDGDIRKIISKMSRAAAKDFLDQIAQDRVDIFDNHLHAIRSGLQADMRLFGQELVTSLARTAVKEAAAEHATNGVA